MQTAEEVGKYVTDGKKVYPYNAYLDDLLQNGKLQFCERPTNVKDAPKPKFRSPVMYTPEQRLEIAGKLGITLGDLSNYSPQEFEAALQTLESGGAPAPAQEVAQVDGFPT